jgi:peptidoglycan/LPS O-acetylase OafA/YrhL
MAGARQSSLDGLRAVAIALVLIDHGFVPTVPAPYVFGPGPMGVRLFFVLSGFLITGILLRARDQSTGVIGIWRAFYVRRMLRIFPLAYLALAIAWIAGVPTMVASPWWYLSYTSNILVSIQGEFAPGLGHFWSLAVEEQFYLVWPAVVLWTPRRWVLAVMVGVALASMVIRWGLVTKAGIVPAYVLTPARLDALAWGGVMAAWTSAGRRVPRFALAVGGIALCFLSLSWPPGVQALVAEPALIALSAAMVATAITARGASTVLSARPLVFLGTISYGVYVWHGLIPDLGHGIERYLGLSLQMPNQPGLPMFAFLASGAILMAWTSWRWFERPLNDLKRHVPYVR